MIVILMALAVLFFMAFGCVAESRPEPDSGKFRDGEVLSRVVEVGELLLLERLLR